MRPASTGSPSIACAAGRSPARFRIAGSTLVPPGGRWSTTNTADRRSVGRPLTTLRRASTPPAEAPMTMTPCPFDCPLPGTTLLSAGSPMIDPMQRVMVAALGDSITAGSPLWDPDPAVRRRIGAALDERSQWEWWAARTRPELSLVNCGVYGERAEEIERRLERCAAGADALVVQGGINDVAQGRPVEGAAAALRRMVRRGLSSGLVVALGDVLPWNNGWPRAEAAIRRLNELVRAIGAEEGVPVLPFHDTLEDPERPGRMREEWTDDGDHPSVEGYRLLGELAAPVLSRQE